MTETTAPPSPPPLLHTEFSRLDPRALKLGQITDTIFFLILLPILAVVGLAVAYNYPITAIPVGVAWFLLLVLCVWTVFSYEPRAFDACTYRIDDRVLELRTGVWWRTFKLLPLSRLQHVDIKRGPLQRRHGLATLVLHTAGTHAAEIEIPGLDAEHAVRLRDHLVSIGGDDAV